MPHPLARRFPEGRCARLIAAGVLLALLLPAAQARAEAPPIAIPAGVEAPPIAIDVGHSWARPGAVSASGRPEFAFNLDLAREIARAVESRGGRVRLIGAEGNIDRLTLRTERAAGAALLLSVHHDSVQEQYLQTTTQAGHARRFSRRFSGFSLFASRRNVDPDASLACARLIGRRLVAEGFSPSLHHAEPIPGENRPLADAALGVYWFDDLVVLRTAAMPAVLLEAGIIVNPEEEQQIASKAVRARLAEAVAAAVIGCPARHGDRD